MLIITMLVTTKPLVKRALELQGCRYAERRVLRVFSRERRGREVVRSDAERTGEERRGSGPVENGEGRSVKAGVGAGSCTWRRSDAARRVGLETSAVLPPKRRVGSRGERSSRRVAEKVLRYCRRLRVTASRSKSHVIVFSPVLQVPFKRSTLSIFNERIDDEIVSSFKVRDD